MQCHRCHPVRHFCWRNWSLQQPWLCSREAEGRSGCGGPSLGGMVFPQCDIIHKMAAPFALQPHQQAALPAVPVVRERGVCREQQRRPLVVRSCGCAADVPVHQEQGLCCTEHVWQRPALRSPRLPTSGVCTTGCIHSIFVYHTIVAPYIYTVLYTLLHHIYSIIHIVALSISIIHIVAHIQYYTRCCTLYIQYYTHCTPL